MTTPEIIDRLERIEKSGGDFYSVLAAIARLRLDLERVELLAKDPR